MHNQDMADKTDNTAKRAKTDNTAQVVGLPAIGRRLGVSEKTLSRWLDYHEPHEDPVVKFIQQGPNSRWVASERDINAWLSRFERRQRRRRGRA